VEALGSCSWAPGWDQFYFFLALSSLVQKANTSAFICEYHQMFELQVRIRGSGALKLWRKH
jgi:hypothetical protein